MGGFYGFICTSARHWLLRSSSYGVVCRTAWHEGRGHWHCTLSLPTFSGAREITHGKGIVGRYQRLYRTELYNLIEPIEQFKFVDLVLVQVLVIECGTKRRQIG